MHVGMATGVANHGKLEDSHFMREEISRWLLAEKLGFDSLWITEHHFSDYSMSPDPLMYLAYVAAKTSRLRLGTQVIVVPWHDPVRLAEQIILLDHLSGGRAILGFGRGLGRMEYEGLRVDQAEARERFDEIVALVMDAMETGFIEGGTRFKQPRRELRPRPIRSLKGRAFCAATSPASLESAAKLGLGKLYMFTMQPNAPVSNDPTIQDDLYLEAWHNAHGADTAPPKAFVSNMVFVDESSARAQALARTYVSAMYRAAIENYEMTSHKLARIKGYEAYTAMSEQDVEAAVQSVVAQAIAGTPQEVLDKLAAVKAALDPQGFFPHFYHGGMPHDECLRNMNAFAKHCLAEVKSWPAPSSIDAAVVAAV